jgi:hypothetical protein
LALLLALVLRWNVRQANVPLRGPLLCPRGIVHNPLVHMALPDEERKLNEVNDLRGLRYLSPATERV